MRRDRIALAVMGIDQYENGVVAVDRILQEAQIETRYLGKLLSPDQVIDGALANACHVIGISCHSWEYLTLVPELLDRLRERNVHTPVVIGGSVITADDGERMKDVCVAAFFGAGATDVEIIEEMRKILKTQATKDG